MNFKINDVSMGAVIKNDIGEFLVGAIETVFADKAYNHLLIYKKITNPLLLRIQSGCALGHIAGDHECDCKNQLHESMKIIHQHGSGLVIYTPEHDGRGRGLVSKIAIYKHRQENSVDSRQACINMGIDFDKRDYSQFARILKYLGVNSVKLISSSNAKRDGLANHGIDTEFLTNAAIC
ncbi:hypothetical protein [Pectobacterium brasiliense]|uniref:hypothetical protein n=1 Tax=Pectobacterium brasiliense TaxID=180957 RepID=UPI0019695FE9|nr:hypothetical protein [Pectobacterium brasiliense]MBN3230982.1 hypothetical protein [Pectobacterium brasiliense]